MDLAEKTDRLFVVRNFDCAAANELSHYGVAWDYVM